MSWLKDSADRISCYMRTSVHCTAAGMMKMTRTDNNNLQKEKPQPQSIHKQHPESALWGSKHRDAESWKALNSGSRMELFLHPQMCAYKARLVLYGNC